MDPLTQGALGAAAAQVVARPAWAARAAVLGALSGMAPDLDVLVRSESDPLLFLEYHRQFSHALLTIPIGALLCAVVTLPISRGRLPFGWAYAFCLLGFATHGLLDACTSYGTQLFWPFSDHRLAWNVVSVVDPLFTLPLLVLVLLSAFRGKPRLARIACVWALAYLAIGVAQRERAEAFGERLAAQRGQAPPRVEAKPAFGSLLLWKTIYPADGRYHVDAVRLGLAARSYPGQSVAALDLTRDLPWLDLASQQARDLERFRWFSSGWVALDSARAERVIDVRYSLLPDRIEALWGIELDPAAAPAAHAAFFTSRDASRERRQRLLAMLFGSHAHADAGPEAGPR